MEPKKEKYVGFEKDMEKMKQLQEKIRKKSNKQESKERTKYTRMKIIAGAFLIEESGQWDDVLKSDKFDKFVTRPIDRKLFGLKVVEEITKENPNPTDKKTADDSTKTKVSKPDGAEVATEKQVSFIKQLIAKTGKEIKDFDESLDQNSLELLPKDKAGPLIDWLKIQ